MLTKKQLSRKIDSTLLTPGATEADIEKLCAGAVSYGFASVCVAPCHVRRCACLLRGSGVAVCTVTGFPLGFSETEVKAFEAGRAVSDGAFEIDMVINVGFVRENRQDDLARDIRAVVEASKPAVVKVILETCLLTDGEKRLVCALSRREGAAFVKTSTGFGASGATAYDVRLMKEASGILVKAAGGIRTTALALEMLEAGADRLGCSAAVAIVDGLTQTRG